jgi:Got1/Sft2-like family
MGFFDKAKEAVGLNPSRDDSVEEEVPEESIFGSICPKLTFQQVQDTK